MNNKKPNEKGKKIVNNLGHELSKINIVSNFGFTIAGNILVSIMIGLFFGNIFGKTKLFLIIFSLLGLVSGIYNGIRYLMKEVDRYEKEEKDNR
ncbi:MAG: AtpZ/AtpI family protein [Fervidobacterium sp.]